MANGLATWQVELDLFRGPLHALLDLIERRELPVTRISLVEVSDQFLALVRGAPALDLDLTADYLHVAARLLLLKSTALLPRAVEADLPMESGDEDDLEARLLLYRRFRDAAGALGARQEAGCRMFGRTVPADMPLPRPRGMEIDTGRLRRAALRALERTALAARAREAAPGQLVPFADVVRLVMDRLRLRRRARFRDLTAEAGDVVVAITMFLAVLELVRQRRLAMCQPDLFGPIELTLESGHGDR